MAVLTKERNRVVFQVPDDIEEVVYPPEVIDRWNKQFEIMKYQLAIGELEPKTEMDLAAEVGLELDGNPPPKIPRPKKKLFFLFFPCFLA
jgi:hypothetical protein